MSYIVLEIQKYSEESVAIAPITTYTNRDQAEARYHTVLAAAAVSSVPFHSVVLLNDLGAIIKRELYEHQILNSNS